jgi:hypothetical protein
MGKVSNVVGVKLFDKARSYLARLKDIALVDAQRGAVNFLLGLSPRKFLLVLFILLSREVSRLKA